MGAIFSDDGARLSWGVNPPEEGEWDWPQMTFGAARDQGSRWLQRAICFHTSPSLESPRWGLDGEGKPHVFLPPSWGYFLFSARDLVAEVPEGEWKVEKSRNNIGILAPIGSRVPIRISWWRKLGRKSRDFAWEGWLVFQKERVLLEERPATPEREV